MTKWYQKASVQTALVTGMFAVIVSLSGGVFSLYKENLRLKTNIEVEIESSIDEFIKEVMRAEILTIEIDLKPNLMTQQETLETLNRLNKESAIISNTINILKVHRLAKKYGRGETAQKLQKLINANSNAQKKLSELVLSVSEKHDIYKRLDDVIYVNKIYMQYVDFINQREEKQNELHSYIANLTLADFEV